MLSTDGWAIRDANDGDPEIVYFIQAEYGGPIKIGRSTNTRIRQRLSDIQCGNPLPLVVRRRIAGGRFIESSLHQHFALSRLAGEWFTPTQELIELANACDGDAPSLEAGALRGAYECGYADGVREGRDDGFHDGFVDAAASMALALERDARYRLSVVVDRDCGTRRPNA